MHNDPIAKSGEICYNMGVMRNRNHYYVSRKNLLTWLMALCLVASAVARIVIAGLKGSGDSLYVWSQIVLPVTATLLYVYIALKSGEERFYKTALPVWMTAIYFGFAVTNFGFGAMVIALYWIALLFFGVLYTQITAGIVARPWLLIPLFLCPAAAIAYFACKDTANLLRYLPDMLMILGWLLLSFAIRVHPVGQYHPTWGDRVDGRRVRSMPPMSQLIPYFMVNRNGATNYFTESFEISHLERYIRQKRREGLTTFGITHVLLACYVRALCRYPSLNRFVAGQKVYSRGEDIQFCMVIKKEMSAESPDTTIKLHLDRHDTAVDIYNKMNAVVDNVKATALDSTFDNTAHAFTLIPSLLLKFAIWLLKAMDYFGLLPRFILEVSPFHGSIFFTSMGSLGIPPIYHHLYDFGNLPVFASFGCKRRATEVQEDGTVVQKKYVDCKFTMDERIADGFYYAAFFKHFKRILMHPETLDNPPEEVLPDAE